MPKGLLLSGSPDWNIDRTFTAVFNFQYKITQALKNKPVYRNPIYLAKEYRKMLNSGKVKNQAELAKMKSVSRARVTQILNLLKLNSSIIQELERFGDPLKLNIIPERMLRLYSNKSSKKQIEFFNILKTLIKEK